MKRFLAIYTGRPDKSSGWLELSESERQAREAAGMRAWMEWGQKHAAAIVDNGGPLGKTRRAGADGVTDIQNLMTGYTVVQAESHEAAARMFENHPHFAIFPGEAVEIMEVLEIPGA